MNMFRDNEVQEILSKSKKIIPPHFFSAIWVFRNRKQQVMLKLIRKADFN